jgi:hypothetical protein
MVRARTKPDWFRAAVINIQGKSRLLSKWFGKSDNNLLKPCENLSSTLVARAPA